MTTYASFGDLWVIAVSWFIVLVLGVVVTFYGVLAYRRSRNRSTLALATGFAFLSVGTAGSWFGIYTLSQSFYAAQFGCAGFLAAGFAFIIFSLHTKVT
jgi:hypothetical protein